MEEVLSKIRPHTSASLLHQKTPANLLVALESTFREQSTEPTPTAYFAALLTTVDGTIQKNDLSLDEGAILPAELYLMSRIAPFFPIPVIRTNLSTLLALTTPLFPALIQDAPALRSQLTLYHTIFLSIDRSQTEMQSIRQSFATILELCVDRRPKVRKLAADIVKDVLEHPPSPLLLHPYTSRVAEWVKKILSETAAGPLSKGKGKQGLNPGAEIAIHLLSFLKLTISQLPPSSIPEITNLLLTLPRLGNTYLSQSCYSILSELFNAPIDDDWTDLAHQLPNVLKVVLSSPPSKSDFALCSTWVLVLGHALVALNALPSNIASGDLHKVWRGVWAFLDSTDQGTRKAAANSLSTISTCFTQDLIASAIADQAGTSVIRKIIEQVTNALDALAYARSIPEVLTVASSIIDALRHRPSPSSPIAAETLTGPLTVKISGLRTSKAFEHKEAADTCLSVAMRVIGPEVMLRLLPLNLEKEQRMAGVEPRAFLLPLIAQPHPSPLSHFVDYFVPLSEKMFDFQQKAETDGRQSEAKVWAVLVSQIWAGLAGYCSGTRELKKGLTPGFSQLLSQLLYTQVELRSYILKALKVMVDYNLSHSASPIDSAESNQAEEITIEEARENIKFLRTQAESWLAVLFNVYGTASRDTRSIVGEVITSWLSVADDNERHNAFIKCFDLFKRHLLDSQKAVHRSHSNDDDSNAATMPQDILALLLPTLSPADSQVIFDFYLSTDVLSGKDVGVQKRGYKALAKIIEDGKITIDAEAVLRKLDNLTGNLNAGAKKDRFTLIGALIVHLPSTSLHVIPSLIPEAVLGTKEPSEKARGAAFEVVLTMGRKMSSGGVVKRNLVDGMDEDVSGDATASVEEFMTMVAGGLAGASPHMISATVTAISRLVFEFKDSISTNMHTEILTTLFVFLSSANREIVKATLGFVKLAIHTLPIDLLRPHLPQLIPALLNWSHDHKNHFKLKVRHIFERLLRRFSWEEVYTHAGDSEAGKVLVNIKKRKERVKRKRAARAEDDDNEDPLPKKPATGDAFEDVLYGSESEEEDDDDDAAGFSQPKGRKKDTNLRLRLDDDEPLDLLQGATAKLTQHAASRRKPGVDASHFKVDDDSGKMIIDDKNAGDAVDETALDLEGNAYREAIAGVDGFTRDTRGRVKFNKDTKKRRRDEAEFQDVEMADAEDISMAATKKKAKKVQPKIGHEFKAKKAGGDIKKNGVDPYAYLTLSQAAKIGGKNKIGIAGKR